MVFLAEDENEKLKQKEAEATNLAEQVDLTRTDGLMQWKNREETCERSDRTKKSMEIIGYFHTSIVRHISIVF